MIHGISVTTHGLQFCSGCLSGKYALALYNPAGVHPWGGQFPLGFLPLSGMVLPLYPGAGSPRSWTVQHMGLSTILITPLIGAF